MTGPAATAVAGVLLLVGATAARQAATGRAAAAALHRLGSVAPARPVLLPPPAVLRRLGDAALPIPPGTAWRAWLVLAGVIPVATSALVGPGAAVVALVAWLVASAVTLGLRAGAAGRLVESSLPDALEAASRSLRGGAGTLQALADAAAAAPGPLRVELGRVQRDVRLGLPLERALLALEARAPRPGVRLAVAALLLGSEAGGGHARALDGVADGIRVRLAVAGEVRALAAQARLSALVIAAAPLGFSALAASADGATAAFLLQTPLGLACLAIGLALDGAGALWMHRIAQVER